jgi:hypothetical protein
MNLFNVHKHIKEPNIEAKVNLQLAKDKMDNLSLVLIKEVTEITLLWSNHQKM